MSTAVKNKKSSRKKNPLKSGNPAVVAAAREKMSSETRVSQKKTSTVEPAKAFVPSSTLHSVEKNSQMKPISVTPKKKQSAGQKAGKIIIVTAMLGGLVLSSFAGIMGGVGSVPPVQEVNNPGVLVNNNGLPLDGSAPVIGGDNTVEVPAENITVP